MVRLNKKPPAPPPGPRREGRKLDPIAPADCLYYLVSRATLVATSVLKEELAAAGVEEVKPAYLGVLMTLWKKDGLGAVDLGRKAGLEPSTMTGLLDRMERDGIVTRQADPDDRRAHRIRLTELGRRFQEPVLRVVDQTLAKAGRGFSEAELARTKEILRGFLANLQERRRKGRGSDDRKGRGM